jgi:fumarate reductase subunit D
MTDLQRKAGLVTAVIVAIVNALSGFGVLPLDASGIALVNTAASSIAALALHILGADNG